MVYLEMSSKLELENQVKTMNKFFFGHQQSQQITAEFRKQSLSRGSKVKALVLSVDILTFPGRL